MGTDAAGIRDSGLTAELAGYSRATDFSRLPDEVVDRAKRVVLDEIGCMVLGSRMPAGERMRAYVASVGGVSEATVVGSRLRAPAGLAALVNGTAAHADQLDGVHVTQGHPAGAAVSAALAVCEARSLSGEDCINAVVLSFDLACRLLVAMGGGHAVRRVHHAHGSPLSAIGVAAGMGRLLGLEQIGIQHAMALAALNIFVPASFYTERNQMSKAMNQGQSAYAGTTGALLASHGFEGHDEILETRDGLIDIWRTDQTDLSRLTAGLGETYSIMDAGFKYYPVGYPIQSPLAGAFDLMRTNRLAAGDVARIRVGMAPRSADMADGRRVPNLCVQDMLSVALVLDRLRYEDAHDANALERPDVRRLRGLVEVVRDADLASDAAERRATWVEIATTDGRVFHGGVRIAPGHWELGGMPWDDLEEKFRSLAEPRIGVPASTRICGFVRDLEASRDLSELGEVMSGGTGTGRPQQSSVSGGEGS